MTAALSQVSKARRDAFSARAGLADCAIAVRSLLSCLKLAFCLKSDAVEQQVWARHRPEQYFIQ